MTEILQERPAVVAEVPPPHLVRALRAAASARAMAERIRSQHLYSEPARAQPPTQKLQTSDKSHPSFAKTVEAAKLWNSSTPPPYGELVPWHLGRHQEVCSESWPKRWMARVFRWRAARSATEEAPQSSAAGLLSVAPAAQAACPSAVVELPPPRAVSGAAGTDIDRYPLHGRRALLPYYSPPPTSADLEEKVVARLPSLRARELSWDELSRELPGKTEHEIKRWRNASASAVSWCRRLTGANAANFRGRETRSRRAITHACRRTSCHGDPGSRRRGRCGAQRRG